MYLIKPRCCSGACVLHIITEDSEQVSPRRILHCLHGYVGFELERVIHQPLNRSTSFIVVSLSLEKIHIQGHVLRFRDYSI